MRLLDRYLLRELLIPLGVCLSAFFIFWVSFDLFTELDDFQEEEVSAANIALYYLLVSPSFLKIVLPMGMLLALLYSLTRHARHNELTAMRAAGIGLWRICLPYFSVGFFASVALFALNELWAPQWARQAVRIRQAAAGAEGVETKAHVTRKLGFVNARDGRSWMIEKYNLKTGEMFRPQVHWRDTNGRQQSVYAESGIYTNGHWVFLNVRQYFDVGESNQHLRPTPITNVLKVITLSETPEQIRSEVWVNARLSSLANTKEADVPLSVILNYMRLHPHPDKEVAPWLQTMLHGRLASPWTCLVVVLIAVPFAGASGRKNMFVGVAGSIGICFAFFVLEQFSIALGAGGHLPPWMAAWLPNLLFSSIGVWMISRMR